MNLFERVFLKITKISSWKTQKIATPQKQKSRKTFVPHGKD